MLLTVTRIRWYSELQAGHENYQPFAFFIMLQTVFYLEVSFESIVS